MANKFTIPQCEFIVSKLAAFEPPRSIATDFCALHPGTRCDENDVRRFDPESGAMLAPELHRLFIRTREAVLLDPKSAPYADQKARLIALSADVRYYRGNNQLPESRAVMRQIAEETGTVGIKAKDKGAATVPGNPADAVPIVSITRRIVDPKAPEPEQVAE